MGIKSDYNNSLADKYFSSPFYVADLVFIFRELQSDGWIFT